MKKILPVLIVVLFSFVGTSCNRSYSCSCTYKDTGLPPANINTDIKGSKNHALHECCVIHKAQLEEQGYVDVTCGVPI